MRLPTRIGFVIAIGVCLVALPTAAAAPAETTRFAANSATFQDSTGEDPAGPDITTLVASNNEAGIISFRVNIPNRPALTQDMFFLLWVDSDNNQATGENDPNLIGVGADYLIVLAEGEVALLRWNGAEFGGGAPASSLVFAYNGGVTISINASDIGNTRRLGFTALAVSGIAIDPITGQADFTNAHRDVAPASGSFNYMLQISRPTLVVRGITTTPAAPKAGKSFTMRLTAARSDTGAVLQNGRVTCIGRAGTARLRAQLARVQGGAVVCTWLIPANAKGKTFKGSAAVVFEGLRVSRSISRKIT